MAKILLLILTILPNRLKTFYSRKFPGLFYDHERIIRIIYSTYNINPNTKKLKANFAKFIFQEQSQKYELSCNRFEIDSLKNCRKRANPDPRYKRSFYGYGCTSVKLVNSENGYSIKYTPAFPKNISHCDIYDDELPYIVLGEASDAQKNLRREQFVQNWLAYEDSDVLKKSDIVPRKV